MKDRNWGWVCGRVLLSLKEWKHEIISLIIRASRKYLVSEGNTSAPNSGITYVFSKESNVSFDSKVYAPR